MQCPFRKSPPLWYGSGIKKEEEEIIMHILLKNTKKHIFWMKFHVIF
jgi:hypothetical protein